MAKAKPISPIFIIDLLEVVIAYDLSQSEYAFINQTAIEAGIRETRRQIVSSIRTNLRSTRQSYYRGLTQPIIGQLKGSLQLVGTLPNMIEQGASAFDMKIGFSKSTKKHQSKTKQGWYLTIPFRWATPDAVAENEAFSNVMDEPMYQVVKPRDRGGAQITKKEITDSRSSYGVIGGRERITRNYGSLTQSQRSAYKHQSPIGAGVKQNLAPYKAVVQGTYVSFRRVSNNSPVNSWIYKGLEARNFMIDALYSSETEMAIAKGVRDGLNALGK